MPLFLFESEYDKLGTKRLEIPDELMKFLRQQGQVYSGKEYRSLKGYKRLQSLISQDYNNPTGKESNGTLSFSDAKRISNDMSHMSQNEDNVEYQMIGGDKMRDWLRNSLGSLRSSVKKVSEVPPVTKVDKRATKPRQVKTDFKVNGKTLKLENTDFNKLITKNYQ